MQLTSCRSCSKHCRSSRNPISVFPIGRAGYVRKIYFRILAALEPLRAFTIARRTKPKVLEFSASIVRARTPEPLIVPGSRTIFAPIETAVVCLLHKPFQEVLSCKGKGAKPTATQRLSESD